MSNLRARIKEEFPGGISSSSDASGFHITIPQPVESLQDPGPPPFLTKTYEIVDDPKTDNIMSWSTGNNSFIVWDSQTFSMTLLPRYFKHNNFSSFIRQLNTYGFWKVDPDRWEFANEGFLRGQAHLLKNIRRRKSSNPPPASPSQQSAEPCVKVGVFGLDQEIERLKRDKQVLMMELIKLRQQQQTSKAYLRQMEQRLERTEQKQQQMMSFLAKAMKNPEFMQQVLQQNDRRKKLEEAINKKRRRRINQMEFSDNNIDICNAVGSEPAALGDVSDLGLDGIDMLPIETIQNTVNVESYSGELKEDEYEDSQQGGVDRGVDDDGFWQGLLNDGHEELGFLGLNGENEDGVDVLAEQLGYLASSPK